MIVLCYVCPLSDEDGRCERGDVTLIRGRCQSFPDTTNHCPVCEANAKKYDALVEAAGIVCFNAEIQSDASMGYATDIYSVPLDDIERLKAALGRVKG